MGKSCLARESVVRVALIVLLRARKIVFACKRGIVSAGDACNLGRSASPANDGVHRDAAPANGVHRDAAPANGGVRWDTALALGGRLGWLAPVIGLVGRVVSAAAPFGGPCLAAVVQVILDKDFGLGIACIVDAVPPLDSGECLLSVKVVEGQILLISRLLAEAWGPARKLRLAHPAIELGGVRRVSAPEVVQDFWGLGAAGGLSSLLFSCQRCHSHCACGATISRVHPKDLEQRIDAWRGPGSHDFLLELAVFTEASGEKSENSADLFLPNLENLAVGKVQHTSSYLRPTWTMR